MRDFETVFNEELSKLETYEAEHMARANAWGIVKRVYKKDGGEFSALAKNFTGCEIVRDPYAWGDNDKIVRVVYKDAKGLYTSDTIDIRHFGNTEGIDPARIIRAYGLKDSYILTVDEIEQAIRERVARESHFADRARETITTYKAHKETMRRICSEVADIVEATKDRENGDYLGCYHIAETIAKTIS